MAKGGINLNPGADATLVVAATRAGLAKTPADYSKTFESVAKSYEKTMEAQSQMWKDIGNVVGVIGADMVANANEFIDYSIKAGGLNPDSYKFLVNDLEEVKQAQKDLGLFPGILGDKETRQKKRELKLKQAELFAEIDMAVESISTGAEAVANGLYDAELGLMGKEDSEMINAIIKSNLKDPITEAGNQAVLSRDEKTDQLMFTLLDKDGNGFEPPRTMTMKEFNKSIVTNVKDPKNVVGTNLGTIMNDIFKDAQTGKSGVIDDQMVQMGFNRLDATLQTDTDWKRAMLAKYGISNTSFADDMKTPGSTVSEDIYVALVKTIGAEKSGQVKAEGALEGVADTDGILGLSQQEINNAYGVYTTNILSMKDPEASKAVFKASFGDRMSKTHEYGYSKRVIDSGDSDVSGETFGVPTKGLRLGPMIDGRYQQKESQRQVVDFINRLKTGQEIQYQGNEYTFRDGNWVQNYGIEGVEEKTIGSADDMRRDVFETTDKSFMNLETVSEQRIDHTTGRVVGGNKSTTASVAEDFMKAEKKFIENIEAKYDFSNYIIQERQFEILPGEHWGNQIRIIDRNDPSKYKDFKTNYSKAGNAQKAAAKWDKWIKDQGIKLRDPLNPN